MSEKIRITPLGAGQQVGRSCIVVNIKDKTIVFDTGIHMLYSDHQRYPDFGFICGKKNINDVIDLVIITHFHLDHCGGLPYLTQHYKYTGPIYATTPTKAMIPYMLEDFRKVTNDAKKEEKQFFTFSAPQVQAASSKVKQISLQETIIVSGIKITSFYAGHVLGAAMFFIEYEGLSVLYTGDYNSYADRHLGSAYAPRLNPNIIITETTYATTIRDTKRDRERKMLKLVTETVENGGKVLIPVFALGRAQQLAVLLETYWNRTQNEIPIYFSGGLIEKANFYYKLFVEWENEKIKEQFLEDNIFNFKKVQVFDKSLIRADSPYVLFATPGMLHGGTSMQVFKEWCGNPKNTIIIPGFCVAGTLGNKLLSGVKTLQIDKKMYEVNMKVQNISFSAHADAKGILGLIRHVNAQNIVFVHGQKSRMETFAQIVKQQLDKNVYRPANKQTIQIECTIRKNIKIQGQKQPTKGYLIKPQNEKAYKLLNQKQLLHEINLHKNLLGDFVEVGSNTKHSIPKQKIQNGILIDAKIEGELNVELDVAKTIFASETGQKKLDLDDGSMKEEKYQSALKEEFDRVVKIKGDIFEIGKAIEQSTHNTMN